MRIALFQPDIPQNTGAMLRLAACMDVGIDIIEPCGFLLDDRRMRRAGMDYLDSVDMRRHASWSRYLETRAQDAREEEKAAAAGDPGGRLLLLTTSATQIYTDFAFAPGDTLLLGRESAGAPPEVHEAADARLRVPMRPGLRSLNVTLAAAMVLGEALRQTGRLPRDAAATPEEGQTP